MKDEMFDRMYQHGRAALNRDLANASDNIEATLGQSLRALHRIEWSAPWARTAHTPRRS